MIGLTCPDKGMQRCFLLLFFISILSSVTHFKSFGIRQKKVHFSHKRKTAPKKIVLCFYCKCINFVFRSTMENILILPFFLWFVSKFNKKSSNFNDIFLQQIERDIWNSFTCSIQLCSHDSHVHTQTARIQATHMVKGCTTKTVILLHLHQNKTLSITSTFTQLKYYWKNL